MRSLRHLPGISTCNICNVARPQKVLAKLPSTNVQPQIEISCTSRALTGPKGAPFIYNATPGDQHFSRNDIKQKLAVFSEMLGCGSLTQLRNA